MAMTPEEKVRQKLLSRMLGPLGYPRGHLAVEKDFFPSRLTRRVDVVCFYLVKDLLKPLLLIECKAKDLPLEAENQLFGYNTEVGAPFICLVGEAEVKMFWQEKGVKQSIPFLPRYVELIEKL
ncbi:MAG: type I restriction enzyme HsdR N-terminal domain-containing protein [Chlamydiae bacterium]|nr:type I restriction enzyme HsdR N-terminal domain-containing protein [Chlamydiota bacterium]